MDKETLSHYGWIVVLVMILAVLLALATPFGTFVADGFKATYTGFDMVGTSAMDVVMDATGLLQKQECGHKLNEPGDHTKKECGHYNCDEDDCGCVPAECEIEGHYTNDGRGPHGVSIPKHGCYSGHKYTCQCEPGWEVPTDGRYQVNSNYKVNGKYVYEAGETLPCGYTPISCDKYWYDEYEYMYNVRRSIVAAHSKETHWITPGNGPYWNFIYIGTDAKPSKILDSICGKPVSCMDYGFNYNEYVVDLSECEVPETITRINAGYRGCSALEKVAISNMVQTLDYQALRDCPNLKEIHFNGTKEEWKNISKHGGWDTNTGEYTVYCTDGFICKSCVGGTATCIDYKICTKCDTEYGELLPHTFVAKENVQWEKNTAAQHKKVANCNYCGLDGYVYASHNFVANADAEAESHNMYQHKKEGTCSECQETGYAYESHSGGTATCTSKKVCTTCGDEYGSLVAHTGGTATCQNKAICSTCNQEYGNIGTHLSHNGKCSICGTECAIESEHSPYSNSINNVLLGTWNYSDAKSVTIEITYQTESTSFDWVYLKSGDNYIDLNGNITSTATKIGGTTKTTETFTTTATSGSVIFRTDGSGNSYYGVQVIVTPNY